MKIAQLYKIAFPFILASIFTASTIPTLASAAPIYTIRDLGNYFPIGINDHGNIIASSNSSLYYFDETGRTLLSDQHLGRPAKINNNNQVIISGGDSRNSIFWQRVNGQDNYFEIPIEAYGLNDNGDVVGLTLGHSTNFKAVLWKGGTLYDLGMPRFSWGWDINNLGQIIGEPNSFIWDSGTVTNINYPGAPIDINNVSSIIGISGGSGSYLWENGVITNIGNNQLEIIRSRAESINDFNLIVGSTQTDDDATFAFIWENGTLFDLNDFTGLAVGWELYNARGINNIGQIIGWGKNPQGSISGFVLTPSITITEPNTIYLIFAGFILAMLAMAINNKRGAGLNFI